MMSVDFASLNDLQKRFAKFKTEIINNATVRRIVLSRIP